MIRTPTATSGVRGTVFAVVIRADGTTVVIDERQCRLWRRKDVDVKSNITDEVLTLARCRFSTTVSAVGTMTPQGPPPGWAVARLEELDDLVSEPSVPDLGDTDTDTEASTGGGGAGNRSGHGDDTNPGEGDGRDNSGNEGSDNPGKG